MYEIHKAIQTALKSAKNWNQLKDLLMKENIQLKFKYKGQSDEVQGISFAKGDYSFKGSEIDRQFSYSKIDFQLKQNDREQNIQSANNHSQNQSSVLGNTASVFDGLFDIQPSSMDYDHDEAEFQYQQRQKKKNRNRLF
jgi:hypothetical protein